ncbi:MAG: hypothetical protein IT200_08655 [Thermoleophilia bacterium]|nr:hypothetical protein [Thermoleophilia bacterium]
MAEPLRMEVDVDALPAPEAEELRGLVDASGVLAEEPAAEDAAPGSGGPPDAVRYVLRIDAPDGAVRVSCDDASAPPPLRPLLGRLAELALRARG